MRVLRALHAAPSRWNPCSLQSLSPVGHAKVQTLQCQHEAGILWQVPGT